MICLGMTYVHQNQNQHDAAESLRNRMLREICGIVQPEIFVAPGGKPYLACRQDVRFSVSHSGSMAVCAVSFPGVCPPCGYEVIDCGVGAPEIGVDIEAIAGESAVPRLRAIAERFFPPPDKQRLSMLPDSAYSRAFCEAWTQYESFVKMTGQGFGNGFRCLDMSGVCFPMRLTEADRREYVIHAAYRKDGAEAERSAFHG